MAEGPIEVVVFDLGGVLIDWDPRHLYRKFFGADTPAMEHFLTTVCTLEWHAQHDAGRSLRASCLELAEVHPEQVDLIMAWAERADEMIAGPIAETVDILVELDRSRVPCYALTNWPAETFSSVERLEFMSCFAGVVVSAHERLVKPDPQIFRVLLDRFGLDPGRALFVDDNERNVLAARSVGIRALRFETPAQLRAILVDLGLLPTPGLPEGPTGPEAGAAP